MKNGFIKTGCACVEVSVGDPAKNGEETVKAVINADKMGVKLLTFSELSLTGCDCGDMFYSDILLKKAKKALLYVAESTSECDVIFAVGIPVRISSKIYNCACVIHKGKILALIPQVNVTDRHFTPYPADRNEYLYDFVPFEDGYVSPVPFTPNITFYCKEVENYCFGVCIGGDFDPAAQRLSSNGAKIILHLASEKATVSSEEKRRVSLSETSRRCVCAIASAVPDLSESTASGVYGADHCIYELGKKLKHNEVFGKEKLINTEIDVDLISYKRGILPHFNELTAENAVKHDSYEFEQTVQDTVLSRHIDKNPFMPDGVDMQHRAERITDIQTYALRKRMICSRSKKLVIGISGGLDSTLALLICVKTADLMAYDRKSVVALTMPCFGTTERTKNNAVILCEKLGVDLRQIDISDAVRLHFRDISHDESVKNAAYENSQARERTQILMDVANDENGMVVGTGDLSELALGWCTYNGDQMSMYGVNCSVPKTLMRFIVSNEARKASENGDNELSRTLYDILDTPVSPELMPPQDGKITQCTEDIIGPYALHDFFIYHTLHNGYGKEKIISLALYAFDGEYSKNDIESCLNLFYRRFATQQFKRSCSADGAIVGSVNLSPNAGFYMPADIDGNLFS